MILDSTSLTNQSRTSNRASLRTCARSWKRGFPRSTACDTGRRRCRTGTRAPTLHRELHGLVSLWAANPLDGSISVSVADRESVNRREWKSSRSLQRRLTTVIKSPEEAAMGLLCLHGALSSVAEEAALSVARRGTCRARLTVKGSIGPASARGRSQIGKPTFWVQGDLPQSKRVQLKAMRRYPQVSRLS